MGGKTAIGIGRIIGGIAIGRGVIRQGRVLSKPRELPLRKRGLKQREFYHFFTPPTTGRAIWWLVAKCCFRTICTIVRIFPISKIGAVCCRRQPTWWFYTEFSTKALRFTHRITHRWLLLFIIVKQSKNRGLFLEKFIELCRRPILIRANDSFLDM